LIDYQIFTKSDGKVARGLYGRNR